MRRRRLNLPKYIYRKGYMYAVLKDGKYLGNYRKLEDAVKALDNYLYHA